MEDAGEFPYFSDNVSHWAVATQSTLLSELKNYFVLYVASFAYKYADFQVQRMLEDRVLDGKRTKFHVLTGPASKLFEKM